MPRPTNFEMSSETRILVGRLRAIKPGETATYAALSQGMNIDLQAEGRNRLESAKRALIRENIVFGTVARVGVKRLTGKELPSIGAEAAERIRGKARRSIRAMLAGAAGTEVGNEDRIAINAHASLLGAIAFASSEKSVAKIADRVRQNQSLELVAAATLDALRET